MLEAERDTVRSEYGDDERLTELYRRMDELTADKPNDDDVAYFEKLIHASELEMERHRLAVYESPFVKSIADMEAELKIKYAEYDKINLSLKNLRPGFKRPTCFHEATVENIEALKQELQKMANECIASGKKLKTDLAAAHSKDIVEREAFTTAKDNEIVRLTIVHCDNRAKLESAKIARQNDEGQRSESLKAINGEIQEFLHKREHGNLTPRQITRLAELRESKNTLDANIAMLTETINKPDFAEQITKNEAHISRLKLLVSQAILYAGVKSELLFKPLAMNNAQLQLFEVVKSTGEIKDTFKLTYNGRDYKRLSLSEKIRAGLEITELVKKLSGRGYPTFIDNSESICVIDNVRPVSQMIFSSVAKGKPLTVTFKESSLRKAA